jgi:hypothetical protein
MTIQITTIRPGRLVSLKTSVRGNVSYRKEDIDSSRDAAGAHTRWQTERTIIDPTEHERAIKARSAICSLIRGKCSISAFGLLCPNEKVPDLEGAVKEARAIAAAFNQSASVTRIEVCVLAGEISDNDAEATRAINSEMRDLIDTMQQGIRDLDVKTVRDAANRAKSLGAMLSTDAANRAQQAIDTAREVARRIVKAGETAATEISESTLARMAECRAAFLDVDLPETEIAAPISAPIGVDFEYVESERLQMVARDIPAIDFPE